jgi:hypothetical protein
MHLDHTFSKNALMVAATLAGALGRDEWRL